MASPLTSLCENLSRTVNEFQKCYLLAYKEILKASVAVFSRPAQNPVEESLLRANVIVLEGFISITDYQLGVIERRLAA